MRRYLWVGGVRMEVVRSDMRRTERGVEGSATVRLPDGRTVEMEGKWEDPYKACDMPGYEENPADIAERVRIDGVAQPCEDENSVRIDEYDITAEEIAEAAAEQ